MPPDVSARHRHSIPLANDFELDGSGGAAAWSAVPFIDLTLVGGASRHRTRCKQLRSATGLYLLVDAEDDRIDCTKTSDGEDLFTEDVVEWFLQPDPGTPVYIEYEISPLGHHLVLIVPNNGRSFHGWQGWKMDRDRTIRRAVQVRGGECRPGAAVTGWSVEVFLPWDLFRGFANVPPASSWRGNVYRIDRDAKWALDPAVRGEFHDMANFAEFTWPGA
jgi:hypothetical protein